MAKLTEVDELLREDHSFLNPDDQCFFLREYTSRKGYTYSETNNLISNLKKPMDRRGTREWQYKLKAVRQAATELSRALPDLDGFTLVPMAPSQARDDANRDDRILQIIERIAKIRNANLDIRTLLWQRETITPFHQRDDRLNPSDLERLLFVDENQADPEPEAILLFDDVLVTGCHFVAAKSVLSRHFPRAEIGGIFVARRVFAENSEDADN